MKENRSKIPEEIALTICKEIRKKNKQKNFSFSKMQCWGCMKYSKDDKTKRCIYGEPETLRGCQLVNKVFDNRFD